MKKHNLSHKELVKLGLHESSHGRSLNQIEADFHRMVINKSDSMRALNDVDSLKKMEERKAARENQAKAENSDAAAKNDNNSKEAAGKNKSSFLFWVLILLILLGIGYLLYEGMLSMEIFGISFKF